MTSQQFAQYLEAKTQAHLSNADNLASNHKDDEAIMEKIRANMYKIVVQFMDIARKRTPNNVPTTAIKRINTYLLPQWQNALAEAQRHDDHVKITHEEVKISTMSEIIKFMEGQKSE